MMHVWLSVFIYHVIGSILKISFSNNKIMPFQKISHTENPKDNRCTSVIFPLLYELLSLYGYNKVWRHMVRCSCLPVTDTFCSFTFCFFFSIFIVEFLLSGQIPPYQILFGGWNPFRNPACLPPSCRRNNTYFIFIFYFLPLQKRGGGGQMERSELQIVKLSLPPLLPLF